MYLFSVISVPVWQVLLGYWLGVATSAVSFYVLMRLEVQRRCAAHDARLLNLQARWEAQISALQERCDALQRRLADIPSGNGKTSTEQQPGLFPEVDEG